jgi:hypothetical protein
MHRCRNRVTAVLTELRYLHVFYIHLTGHGLGICVRLICRASDWNHTRVTRHMRRFGIQAIGEEFDSNSKTVN